MAAQIGWRNFLLLLSFFSPFKSLYDTVFQAARIAQIKAAKNLPDYSVRGSKVTQKHKTVIKKAKTCRTRFQSLKSYINGAFSVDERESLYQEAGQAHYAEAGKNNWEEIDNLMTDGNNFITAHLTELTAANNMPAAFQTTFANDYDAFSTALSDFYAEEEAERQAAANKINANNAVHEALMLMLTDAQQIFVDDEDKRKIFTFDHLMSLVTNKIADLTGNVTTLVPTDVLSDFEIHIIETDDFVLTDTDGLYDFGVLAAGTYNVKVSKVGFVTQTINNVEILTGTTKTLDIVMLHA